VFKFVHKVNSIILLINSALIVMQIVLNVLEEEKEIARDVVVGFI
jgi:hypothetical protein